MKIMGILLVLFTASANAQTYHVYPGAESVICKASGQVDGITNLFFTETTVASQICGSYQMKADGARAETRITTCVHGSLYGEENVLSVSPVQYGVNKISLRYDAKKGFSVVKSFECDYNHEEKCMPGSDEVISEEALECRTSQLKY